MSDNLKKIAQELDVLVDTLLSRAQAQPMGGPTVVHGKSIKDEINGKFQQSIQNDTMVILQKIADAIWNKTETSFGYFEIDVKASVAKGNVSLGFVLSPELGGNKENNQVLAKALNGKLRNKYSGKMSALVKSLEGGRDYSGKLDLFQMNGSV
jgi:hypothetical protein